MRLKSFFTTINQHFSGELKLYRLEDDLWLVGTNLDFGRFNQLSRLLILSEKNIDDFSTSWQVVLSNYTRFLNELQMLLFNLPINQQRQDDGLMQVNSVWFWNKHRPNLNLARQQMN